MKNKVIFGVLSFFLFSTPTFAVLYDSTGITDYDIISDTDPSMYLCMEYLGTRSQEMPDDRNEGQLWVNGVHTFRGYYSDGAEIEFHINPEFGSKEDAKKEALRYADRLGKIPSMMRKDVKRLVAHGKGKLGFSSDKGLIITYSDYTDAKLAHNHLEESLFHESVHASFDDDHRTSPEWIKAQKDDGEFLTGYGERKPEREDLAETALFAYSIKNFPGRIPTADEDKIKETVPHRLAYLDVLLPSKSDTFSAEVSSYACDGTKSQTSNFGRSESVDEVQTDETNNDSSSNTQHLNSSGDFYDEVARSKMQEYIRNRIATINPSQEKLQKAISLVDEYKRSLDSQGYSQEKYDKMFFILDVMWDVLQEYLD